MTGDVLKFPASTTERHDGEHPAVSARIRVVSDGTWAGTRVLANGKPVRGVTAVVWRSPENATAQARIYLEIVGASVELEGVQDDNTGVSTQRT